MMPAFDDLVSQLLNGRHFAFLNTKKRIDADKSIGSFHETKSD